MTIASVRESVIYKASRALSPVVELHVHLVKGRDFAVLIDSGVAGMYEDLLAMLERAGVAPRELRFLLNTHSHHDHIGSNGRLKQLTGCIIGAHPLYAEWHSDFERHYQEFARAFPDLIPDTSALRAEVLATLDVSHKLDLHLQEGIVIDLGGGVRLEALSFPGHMKAELGFFEAKTSTLILGDAITGLDWPFFHGHLDVAGYRRTLKKIVEIVTSHGASEVLLAHFPPMSPEEAAKLVARARDYLDQIEVALIRIAAEADSVSLEDFWQSLCQRMDRAPDFRALGMVNAHLTDLAERGVLRELGDRKYRLA